MNGLDEIYQEIDNNPEEVLPRARVAPKAYKAQLRAKTYIQYLVSSYEPSIRWDNETFFQDRSALYSLANQVGESQLKSIMDWAKSKSVHVRAVIKVLNRAKMQRM